MTTRFFFFWMLSLALITALASFLYSDVLMGMVIGGIYTLASTLYIGRKEQNLSERNKHGHHITTRR